MNDVATIKDPLLKIDTLTTLGDSHSRIVGLKAAAGDEQAGAVCCKQHMKKFQLSRQDPPPLSPLVPFHFLSCKKTCN